MLIKAMSSINSSMSMGSVNVAHLIDEIAMHSGPNLPIVNRYVVIGRAIVIHNELWHFRLTLTGPYTLSHGFPPPENCT